MSTENRRTRHAGNAAAGIALTGAGEALGHYTARRGTKAGQAAALALPRGMKALGIPLAATGVVGAARGRGRVDDVDVKHLPGKVARRTVKLRGENSHTQRAKDAGLATVAGGLTGMAVRPAARTTKGRIAVGTVGALTGATGTLYGTQKGREANRRKARMAKAEKPKTMKVPVPTVSDTREDWKLHRQRRHASNYNAAATAVGAAALAARAPHLLRPKVASAKLVRLRAKGDKASRVLGGAAAGSYIAGGAINYRTQRHDLAVQGRRLAERDQLLRRKAPVQKDRFTRKYGQHISPEAEAGYDYLRRGRNEKRGHAVVNTAAGTVIARHGLKHTGGSTRALLVGAGAATAVHGINQARGAKRWNGHMKKIKAKAYERAAAGEYGRGRTAPQAELAKALIRRPSGLPFPKGLRRAPSMRDGGVRRTAGGKMVVFRGAYG